MPGTLFPSPRDPDMHHGTWVTHVPWCMPGSLTGYSAWKLMSAENWTQKDRGKNWIWGQKDRFLLKLVVFVPQKIALLLVDEKITPKRSCSILPKWKKGVKTAAHMYHPSHREYPPPPPPPGQWTGQRQLQDERETSKLYIYIYILYIIADGSWSAVMVTTCITRSFVCEFSGPPTPDQNAAWYTTLVPKFEKHRLFADFGRKEHPFLNRNSWFWGQ